MWEWRRSSKGQSDRKTRISSSMIEGSTYSATKAFSIRNEKILRSMSAALTNLRIKKRSITGTFPPPTKIGPDSPRPQVRAWSRPKIRSRDKAESHLKTTPAMSSCINLSSSSQIWIWWIRCFWTTWPLWRVKSNLKSTPSLRRPPKSERSRCNQRLRKGTTSPCPRRSRIRRMMQPRQGYKTVSWMAHLPKSLFICFHRTKTSSRLRRQSASSIQALLLKFAKNLRRRLHLWTRFPPPENLWELWTRRIWWQWRKSTILSLPVYQGSHRGRANHLSRPSLMLSIGSA